MGRDDKIWKSVNEGGQFVSIYQFEQAGRVLEIEQSRGNPDVMYCVYQIGTSFWDDCHLYKSKDGGYSWEPTAGLPTNDTWRVEISINPENENELWVVSTNAFSSQSVFNTLDGGSTWINKSTDQLTGHTPSDIKFQGGTDQVVYLSTDMGFFHWSNSEEEWIDCSQGLPLLTRSMEVEPFYRDSKIRMATRGRGIYESELVVKSKPLAQPMTTNDIVYCSRDTVQLDCYSILDHEGASWSWSISPEPIYISDKNIRNPKALLGEGSYDVSLEITDGQGNSDSKTIENMITVDNRCAIDTFPGAVLSCNQIGDYVATPDMGLFTNEMTFSAWIKPNGVQPEFTGIVMNNGDAGGLNFRPGMELGYHWPGGAWWWSSGLIVPQNEWSYVAMVARPDGVTVYLNGVGVTHTTQLEEINISSILMGSYKGWESRNYNGLMDEVCIWTRALSQEEIRELRHLTKDQLEDPELLAYYQFNEGGLPTVLDKIGDKHARLNGNAGIDSNPKVPVGKGTSQRLTISNEGIHTFDQAGVSIEIPQNGIYPNGELVATRIHAAPQPNYFSETGADNYWIINNYGSEIFGPISDFRLEPNSTLSTSFLENPSVGSLYNQGDNIEANNWSFSCNSMSTENNFIVMEPDCIESPTGQFYIISEDSEIPIVGEGEVVSIEETDVQRFNLYPNPVVRNGKIFIDNQGEEILRLRLYNTEGKLLSDQFITNGDIELTDLLNSGIYFFQLESSQHIQTGKLIVR